ncbi:mitochondrial amidoxime-reducing component 1-like [Nilaparvata lugens]|uniref:mitochondrial amidoxime-reducing component 1-like n=1 Tax=Nilaparvata lugens TaxID=108931 RepID=UPI00193CD491|nr:mitochondrial amidoxime-reducing component 1-like [Nilaparvata lugens]
MWMWSTSNNNRLYILLIINVIYFHFCRCVVITMNPSNGIYNKEREPLKTLESFRQVTDPEQKKLEGKSPVFGQYFGIHNLGSISVGDTVYIGSN